MKLEKTFEEQSTLNQAARAWNIECLRYEIRDIISPTRSRKQWRYKRKPSTSNVRRARRSEEDQQSEINLTRRKQQDCDNVEQHTSVQDRRTCQPKQERTRDQPVYFRQEINKPKTVKTKEAKNFGKSEAELVDVMDTLQHAISIIEKEIAKNLAFLQKEIDTRSTNNATVALINSFQQTVSMMRRTTEQINNQFF